MIWKLLNFSNLQTFISWLKTASEKKIWISVYDCQIVMKTFESLKDKTLADFFLSWKKSTNFAYLAEKWFHIIKSRDNFVLHLDSTKSKCQVNQNHMQSHSLSFSVRFGFWASVVHVIVDVTSAMERTIQPPRNILLYLQHDNQRVTQLQKRKNLYEFRCLYLIVNCCMRNVSKTNLLTIWLGLSRIHFIIHNEYWQKETCLL